MKTRPEYAALKIAHGKDRCGNPPRPINGNKKAAPITAINADNGLPNVTGVQVDGEFLVEELDPAAAFVEPVTPVPADVQMAAHAAA
jgi:hypothetical protein